MTLPDLEYIRTQAIQAKEAFTRASERMFERPPHGASSDIAKIAHKHLLNKLREFVNATETLEESLTRAINQERELRGKKEEERSVTDA